MQYQARLQCSSTEWKSQQKQWNEIFEIRRVDSIQLDVLPSQLIAADRPLGEWIGSLRPDSDNYEGTRALYAPSARPYITEPGNVDEVTCYIDSYEIGSFTRFVRDSCNPNTAFGGCRHGKLRMNCLVSLRQIGEGEEFT
ncbi:hypothetical protein K469DRAFT_805347 [Zopfia rhizophila CBS 207.26]|uniref:SET domain-containing protein n=1 Tax=Zopfia rhizophila CBS 207.26 TaxID=1314779 RepID=A0A6A6EQ27_9PEZI|nr:hypothetical protein K469DRAFT_805347 [Zopfia rhizophila CBS 207.26]